MKKRLLSMILAVIIAITTVFAAGATAFAEESLYLEQMESGKCTLASAAMMMRSKAKMEGNDTWVNITQQSIRGTAWIEGQGLRHSFTFGGMVIGYSNLKSANKKAALLALLERYPEGVEIYVRSLPHAVFLTRYDAETDTFYCADPGLSATEMKLEDSWLRKVYKEQAPPAEEQLPEVSEGEESEEGSLESAPEIQEPAVVNSVQQQIIDAVDSYWYIVSYKEQQIPEYKPPVAEEHEIENPEEEPEPPVNVTPPAGDTVKFSRVKTYSNSIFSDVPSYECYVTSVKGA